MYLTLVPAYGRDYKNKKQLLADWTAGKDFLVCDISSPHNGRYANKANLKEAGIKQVNVRYKGLRNVAVLSI